MRLDTDEPIGDRFGTVDEMREAMIFISQQVQNRVEHQKWAEHLRFLTGHQCLDTDGSGLHSPDEMDMDESSASSISDGSSEPCICSKRDIEFFSPYERQLRLTSPSELPECVHYVAVSYCWTSTARHEYTGEPFLLYDAQSPARRPKCPQSLLDRVIQFASWKECSFLWIDQECIDQDNSLDQTIGIQSMDLVYQRAVFCLAVLEARIDSQCHIDTLALLLENGPELEDEDVLQNVCDGLRIVMADPWFKRSWCLQESVAGNRRMTLLVRHADSLDIPDLLESPVDGCFELDLSTIHNVLVAFQPRELRQIPGSVGSSAYTTYQSILDDWYESMAPDASSSYDVDSRTVCNGAQALCYLEKRQNLVVADRIAIMANLCNYDRRLDPVALDQAGFDFSLCALVLSAINGDFTLIAGYHDFNQSRKSGRKSIMLSNTAFEADGDMNRPFTWSLPRSARLAGLSYLEHDADPVRVTVDLTSLDQGLGVKGNLWTAGCRVDLSRFAEDFKTRWPQTVLDEHRFNRGWDDLFDRPDPVFEDIGSDFLVSLLCELTKSGFTQIVQMIWEDFKFHPLRRYLEENEEAIRYDQASFADVVEIETKKTKWFSPLRPHTSTMMHDGRPFPHTTQREIQYLVQTVLAEGELILSRPLRTSDRPSSYAAIFESVDVGDVVFVPDGLHRAHYNWYPHCWLVQLGESSSVGHSARALCLKLICGMWGSKLAPGELVLLQ